LAGFAQNTLLETREQDKLFKTGVELLMKEKYAGAKESFQEYLEETKYVANTKDLKEADASYYVAYCALNLFNPDAEKLFLQFLKDYPWSTKASLAYFELGNFFYNTKKYQKTIDYLEKVDKEKLAEDKLIEMRFKLGYAYFSQKEFEKAGPLFDRVKNGTHKYSYAASYYSGYLELKNGKYDEALVDLKNAGQNEAYAPIVPYLLANTYYQKGEYDKLIAYSEEALKQKDIQEKKELYLLLAEAQFKKKNYEKSVVFFQNYAGSQKSLPAPIQYRLGFSQYMTGKYAKAIDNLKPIAATEDALGQTASYYLGLSYLKVENKQYALQALGKAAQETYSKEIQEEALLNYAKVNAELENLNEAITALKQFSKSFPQSVHTQEVDELLGEAFLKSNNYTEAINYIESLSHRSLRLNTAYQRVTFYKGIEAFNNKNFEGAVDFFSKSTSFPLDKDVFLAASFWKGEAYSIMRQYDKAINSYAEVFQNAEPGNVYFLKSRYGIAYAYYNKGDYEKALPHFEKYVEALVNAKDKLFYDDAILRLADLFAYNKEYAQSIKYYNQAIQNRNPELDYAQYRKGVVQGFHNKDAEAIESYDRVIELYPSSIYYDDALFGKAELLFSEGNFEKAISLFSQLIQEKPNSQYIPYVLNYRAIGYRNLQKYDLAIADYTRIMQEFPSHSVAIEALSGLQDALNKTDRTEEFAKYRALFAKNNPENKSLVTIDYEAARSLYNSQKYEKAIEAFNDYIQKYPDSPNNPNARYFLAESYQKAGELEKALATYKEVISEKRSDFFTRSILRIADIYFEQAEYNQARKYYQLLLSQTNSAKERSIAWGALMEAYFKLEKYDSVQYYADQITQYSKFSMDANKASLYQGKVAYKKGEYDKAIDYFIATINMAKDKNAAEAKYMIAKIYYDQKKYKQSLEVLYELNNVYYVYEEWLGKSFLLIADNFIQMDEVFQAKATLQSIIEKATYKESVKEAKKKLADLEAQGKEGDKNE